MKTSDYTQSTDGQQPLDSDLAIPHALSGARLDQVLAALLPQYSRSRMQTWIAAGAVQIDEVPVLSAKRKVWVGERLRLKLPTQATAESPQAEAIALDIVFEDMSMLVINKPAGLVVHPGNGNWSGTLLNALLHHAPALSTIPRAGIVHRLDKDTSGLLVVAKTLEAQTDLVRQLQARSVRRVYWALVEGVMRGDGAVNAPIARHPTARVKMAIVARGKTAVTHYRVLEAFARHTLIECRLETGRTHQIRVHMQSLNHPLVGDAVYGAKRGARLLPRQALHAAQLGLIHPHTRQPMQWDAPLPADMQNLLLQLRATGSSHA